MKPPLITLLLACAAAGWPAMLSTVAADNPNIVVIMADDLGWKDLRCYGNPLLETPHIDQLAAEGMRFTDAYAASPVRSPTRGAMMTGLAPARLRLTNHAPGHPEGFSLKGSNLQEAESVRHLELAQITIAERLKEAGYVTAHIGKWHLSYVAQNDRSVAEADLRPEKHSQKEPARECYPFRESQTDPAVRRRLDRVVQPGRRCRRRT